MRSRGKEEQIQLIDTHNQGFLSVWRREGFELKPTTNLSKITNVDGGCCGCRMEL
jgi:hypothetical protein|tara:strand:- start:370 stop:534 length:165 start_codon:yes stop_codon:yes gene_type:complete